MTSAMETRRSNVLRKGHAHITDAICAPRNWLNANGSDHAAVLYITRSYLNAGGGAPSGTRYLAPMHSRYETHLSTPSLAQCILFEKQIVRNNAFTHVQ